MGFHLEKFENKTKKRSFSICVEKTRGGKSDQILFPSTLNTKAIFILKIYVA